MQSSGSLPACFAMSARVEPSSLRFSSFAVSTTNSLFHSLLNSSLPRRSASSLRTAARHDGSL
jgi:hypothetical protein